MFGRCSFFKSVCSLYSCVSLCEAPVVLWWRGMNNWLGEEIERARGRRKQRKRKRKRTGCSGEVQKVHHPLSRSLSLHLRTMLFHYCTLTVTLFGQALDFAHLHFVFLSIPSQTDDWTQLCPDSFWAIWLCEALSKYSHALLLSSTLFSFLSGRFLLTNWTVWLCWLVFNVRNRVTQRPVRVLSWLYWSLRFSPSLLSPILARSSE